MSRLRRMRLKTVRAAAELAHLRPTLPAGPFVRVIADKPQGRGRKTQAVQAQGVRQPGRPKINDAIKPETIERIYEGETAVLFATGPSLTPEVASAALRAAQTSGFRLFGCNDSYKLLPYLTVHYACDFSWWRVHFEHMRHYRTDAGMWTQEPNMSASQFPGLRRIAGSGAIGLSDNQSKIHFGNNSGFQLINLAHLFGIKRMILCGYNMQVIAGRRHFFGDHPEGLNRNGSYQSFASNYDDIKPAKHGLEIVNATPQSALQAFPKVELTEILERWK